MCSAARSGCSCALNLHYASIDESAERQRKQQIDAARLQKKEEQARQMAEKKRERLERGRTPPSELWRGENASFSKFDEQVG